MTHPYKLQPPRAFWKTAVAHKHPLDITGWYEKRFPISDLRIAAAGSCFAQHIGRRLRQQDFKFIDVEPPPPALAPESYGKFGFQIFSGRFGNVYTTRQLVQLIQRATGEFVPQERVWRTEGGFVDPFRPTIEPVPFQSEDEVIAHQDYHLAQVLRMFETTQCLIFTLGLTETWMSRADGAAYPICPGVSGGEFDDTKYVFNNLTFWDVLTDLRWIVAALRSINNKIRFILTVSPVPLAATATHRHVAVATTHSKAILRAAAGFMVDTHPIVDYFPSFEIVSSAFMSSFFWESDKRSVSRHGVEHVMNIFFAQHPPPARKLPASGAPEAARARDAMVVCDEELLAQFGAAR